jgi:hypothetical protein
MAIRSDQQGLKDVTVKIEQTEQWFPKNQGVEMFEYGGSAWEANECNGDFSTVTTAAGWLGVQ